MSLSGPIRHREVEAGALASVSDGLRAIFEREYELLLIRNVFDAEQMATVSDRLADAGRLFPFDSARLFAEAEQTETSGMIILGNSISRKTAAYFEDARRFREGCDALFAGGPGAIEQVQTIFRGVSGGRPVQVPSSEDGSPYGAATIRMVKPGCDLLIHCGNFFYTWDTYNELRPRVDTRQQFSWFVVLRAPEAGGELEVFSADFTDPSAPVGGDSPWDAEAIERDYASKCVAPRAGDMILFDGGRYFHRVRPVRGATSRLTLGGFLAFTPEQDAVLHWA